MKLKTIDLCAGIGGIRRGFELAGGYRNIASAEIDEMACKTYEHLFHEDPRNDVTNEKFKKHLQTLHYDVLMAGFPCQAFSSVGLQHGFEDKTKGTIFFDIAKIIKMTRPKVVFLENVQNLLSHDKQATFKTIVDTLDRQLDYHIVGVTHDKDGIPQYKRSAFLRNSRDFGVPQNRPRVYIVAFSRAYFGQHISLLPEEAPTKRSRTPVFKSLADVLDKKVDSRFFLSSGYLDTFVLEKCKFFHAVWFPSVTNDRLRNMTLPSEGDKTLVLTKEALADPKEFIDRIYALHLPSSVETKLSEIECKRLVREIFCPQFNVFPSASFEADLKKIVFHRLLDEQAGILDFLDEQLTAAVNGAAGTGKTMIAVEKARRHAAAGERVLFLCFNAQLKDFLEENYARDLVSYYTIAGFACKICNTVKPNYDELREKLEDYYISDSFPYKHVIIDEGQDFGIEAIEETDIIQLIHDIIVGLDQGGTFYVFYDRLQLIQAKEMPKFIGDLDCRLTLYRNCRNTENIAVTSLRPITERKPKVFEGTVKGAPARIHFCDSVQNERERIDSIIDNLAADGYRDVVLLTCKTEATSILSDSVNNGRYRNKYLFTTCRKFKGLEADVVILLDVDKATFEQENVLIFYVGTSRARIKLEITAILSDDDCKEILTSVLNYQGKIRRAKKDFAGALNAIGCLET